MEIIEILKDYKEARHDKITGSKWNIYKSKYYKEVMMHRYDTCIGYDNIWYVDMFILKIIEYDMW